MSTIIDRINSINQGVQDVKADFKTALENKGVGVADNLKLKDYPNLINEIKGSVTENIDLTNLTPENIRAGVTINGVTGTLVEQWDVVISPNRPENPRNGTIWIRDLSDGSNNESGDDSGGGDSGGNNTGGSDSGDEPESSLTKVEVYAEYLENPINGYYFNGTYTIQDQTKSGKEAVYVNEDTNTELYYSHYWLIRPVGTDWGFIMLYNSDAENPWEFTSNSFYDDYNLRSFTGTVTLVADEGGESGSESEDDSNKIIVSNASQSNVNGTYVPYTDANYLAYKHEDSEMYLWLNTDYPAGLYWIFSEMHPNAAVNDVSKFLYGSLDNGNQSPIGLTYGAMAGTRPNMPIVEAYAGGGSDSGESGESGGTSKGHYSVSGSSTAEVDGDYINTGRISYDRPVYTNGIYYMRWYTAAGGMWEITEEDENSNGKPPKHNVSSSDTTPPTSGWSGGITVTQG